LHLFTKVFFYLNLALISNNHFLFWGDSRVVIYKTNHQRNTHANKSLIQTVKGS